MGRSRPPGLHDVARLAGVSHQTVSRVINGSPRLRPETRARVEAAIDELGYRPNLAARALVTNRSHLVGVIVTGPDLFGPRSAHEAVSVAAKEAGPCGRPVAGRGQQGVWTLAIPADTLASSRRLFMRTRTTAVPSAFTSAQIWARASRQVTAVRQPDSAWAGAIDAAVAARVPTTSAASPRCVACP